ncbi:MAG: hypothetical protein R2698_10170 [Microthrixaceae bacterium]
MSDVGLSREPLPPGLVQRIAPTVLAVERVLPVPEPLRELFPAGGLVRGSRVALHGGGATSLTMVMLAEASREGSWISVVGSDAWGWGAAAWAGWALGRSISVASPPPGRWAGAVAALLDAVDVVVLADRVAVGAAEARRLSARARERGVVLVETIPPRPDRVAPLPSRWPDGPDLTVEVEGVRWEGIGHGRAAPTTRRLRVTAVGRRGAARPRRLVLELDRGARPLKVDVAADHRPLIGGVRHLRSVGSR